MTNFLRAFPRIVLWLVPFVALSCGSGAPAAGTRVVDLGDQDAIALCREFITKACAKGSPTTEPACNGCDPCGQTASAATIRAKCAAPITVGNVRGCIDSSFDMPTCTGPQMGGCMFDVADELCP